MTECIEIPIKNQALSKLLFQLQFLIQLIARRLHNAINAKLAKLSTADPAAIGSQSSSIESGGEVHSVDGRETTIGFGGADGSP
jgi:hypothetical protein